jgi:NADH-quinone oxidoreductase subunit J
LSGNLTLFYLFAGVAVLASLLVIGQRNPIYSILFLIASFGALAGLYVLLDAPFVAVTQIIVYAGAIMVLFLFVVMLLNVPLEDPIDEDRLHEPQGARRFGAALAGLLLVELGWALARAPRFSASRSTEPPNGELLSSVRDIGQVLYRDYAVAFEVTSILIIVAMLGAVLLARRDTDGRRAGS